MICSDPCGTASKFNPRCGQGNMYSLIWLILPGILTIDHAYFYYIRTK